MAGGSSDDPQRRVDRLMREYDGAGEEHGGLVKDLVAAGLFGGDEATPMIGRFRILGVLGSGGMGTVYESYDPRHDARVAIKLARSSDEPANKVQARLVREARLAARLVHPNVVAVREWGVHEGQVFVVMELIEGRSLDGWLTERQRPWLEILQLFLAVGDALAAAHALGVVHRDFKPKNVLVDADDHPRIADFGLARPIDPRTFARREGRGNVQTSDYAITEPGVVGGTPMYMAPELFAGATAGPQTDLYAYCFALLEALAGAELPEAVVSVLRRGIADEPTRRWPSMDTLLRALTRAAGLAPRPLAHRRSQVPR